MFICLIGIIDDESDGLGWILFLIYLFLENYFNSLSLTLLICKTGIIIATLFQKFAVNINDRM